MKAPAATVLASQPPVPLVPVQADQPLSIECMHKLEELGFSTAPKLALLMRWSEAESLAHHGCSNEHLEQLAWRGMEMLCHDVLKDVEELLRASGVQESGFATLANEEGGTE